MNETVFVECKFKVMIMERVIFVVYVKNSMRSSKKRVSILRYVTSFLLEIIDPCPRYIFRQL